MLSIAGKVHNLVAAVSGDVSLVNEKLVADRWKLQQQSEQPLLIPWASQTQRSEPQQPGHKTSYDSGTAGE